MTLPVLLAIALGAVVLWLGVLTLRAARVRRQARSAYFSAVMPLFDSTSVQTQPTGFPRLTARRGTDAFDLQALPDSLTFRKLPALWVMVTLPAPVPVHATLDIMTRPTGNEPFSAFATLPQSLPRPAFLPEGTGIRSDDAARIPPEHILARHAALFDDPRVKELVISPKGLRIVILGDEADRGRYLIFRDGEVGMTPLPSARLAPILDRLRALRDDLVAQAKDAA